MTWMDQDLRVLSRKHISREVRVFWVRFWTQIFVCVKKLTFRNPVVPDRQGAGPERNWTNICNFSWQSVLKYTVSLCQFRRQLEQSPGLEVKTIWQSPGFACPLYQRLGVGLCLMLNQHSTSSPLVPVHTDSISILNWQTGKLKIYNWSFTAGLGRKTGWPADNQDGPLIY